MSSLKTMGFFILQALFLYACSNKPELQGNWKLIEYTFLDSSGKPFSSFKLNDDQSIRNFLIKEMSIDPSKSEQDSMIDLLRMNYLLLGKDSTYSIKGLGLILPSSKRGFEFSSSTKGKWNSYSDTLTLSLTEHDNNYYRIIDYGQNKLVLELLIDNRVPFNKFTLKRQ